MSPTRSGGSSFGDPVLERTDRDVAARKSRHTHRCRARRPVHRRPRFDALPVVSPDRLQRGRLPRPRQPGRPAAAPCRRRSLFQPVPGIAGRVLATRPLRPGPPPERGRAGAGLRERAGAAGGRAVGGERRCVELHRAARARPAAGDRPGRRRRTSARPRASSTCASRPASCRRRRWCRSARSTSRRSPRFRPSSADRRAGEPDLDPARTQSGADPAREDHRPARRAADSGGPSLRAAAAPARHPASRAEPRRRQRQHRRGARALLSDDFAHRRARNASARPSATS